MHSDLTIKILCKKDSDRYLLEIYSHLGTDEKIQYWNLLQSNPGWESGGSG